MRDWVKVQIEISNSFQHLGKASIACFGDTGKTLQLPAPAETVIGQLDKIKPVAKGNTAEWRTNPKLPTKLVLVDGHWKLDLYSSFGKPDDLVQISKTDGRIAKYIERIARDIDEDKFKSVADVRNELKAERAKMNQEATK